MRTWKHALLLVALPALLRCGGVGRPLWHDQLLPSGKSVKVTSFNLVWGVEHDERDTGKDCFAIDYVTAFPADTAAMEKEALEVFELIRPASELWGFKIATVAAFPDVEHRPGYQVLVFTRGADGTWTFERHSIGT